MVLDAVPRMADFAREAAAAAPSFGWTPEDFIRAYAGNHGAAVEAVLEADVVAQALLSFMDDRLEWEGTSSELLVELEKLASDRVVKSKEWPSSRGLSGRLRRLAPELRRKDISTSFDRRTSDRQRRRLIAIEKRGTQPSEPSGLSNDLPFNDLGPDGMSDGADGADRPSGQPSEAQAAER